MICYVMISCAPETPYLYNLLAYLPIVLKFQPSAYMRCTFHSVHIPIYIP